MSPWVLPERTLGTVRYTETYPGNYLICRTVPSLLQTVPSLETRFPDHRDICKRIARKKKKSVYIGWNFFLVSQFHTPIQLYKDMKLGGLYMCISNISSGRNRDSQGTVESKQGTVRHIR